MEKTSEKSKRDALNTKCDCSVTVTHLYVDTMIESLWWHAKDSYTFGDQIHNERCDENEE